MIPYFIPHSVLFPLQQEQCYNISSSQSMSQLDQRPPKGKTRPASAISSSDLSSAPPPQSTKSAAPNKPQRKKRPAPPPPLPQSAPPPVVATSTGLKVQTKGVHSRNSSHSSGFDESNMSPLESPGNSSQESMKTGKTKTSNDATSVESEVEAATTTTVSASAPAAAAAAAPVPQAEATVMAGTLGRKKRRAPAPPPPGEFKVAGIKLNFQQQMRHVTWRPLQALLSCFLTHWGCDKMAVILQTIFSNAFSWVKVFELWLKFHWSLFPRVQLTTCQHWFR